MLDNPISISEVYNRYTSLHDCTDRSKMNTSAIKRPMTFNIAESYLSSVNSFDNANRYYGEILSLLNEVSEYFTESQSNKLKDYVKSNILVKLESNKLDRVYDLIENATYSNDMKKSLLESIDNIRHCDRILNNNEKLNKRFNIDKLISEKAHLGCEKITIELCQLIDTYSIPVDAKYNVALENILYSLNKKFGNGIGFERKDIVNTITEYFLLRESVITDTEYSGLLKVLESNKFISKNDIKDINYIFENENTYTNRLDMFIEQCEEDTKDLLSQLKNVKSEKDFMRYVNECTRYLKTASESSKSNIINALKWTPLITRVSNRFVEETCTDIGLFESVNNSTLLDLSKEMHRLVPSTIDLFEESYIVEEDFYGKVLESSKLKSSDTVNDIINKFKADQEKSVGRFSTMITRIWAKDPKDIINGTPNFFALIRNTFIFTVSMTQNINIFIPYILLTVDGLISKCINHTQANKFIFYLKDERDIVEKKMDKLTKDTIEYKNAKQYLKCINKCIMKMEAFKGSLGIREDADIQDFSEACVQLLSLTESVNHALSLNKDNILNEIENNIERIVKEDLDGYSMIIANCPSVISLREYSDILDEYRKNTNDHREANDIIITLDKLYTYRLEGVNEPDSLIELEAVTILEQAIQESFKLNDVKLIFMNFKKKVKDLSTKAKSIWQSIDASASNFKRSIEKSMTSDRREAIIKGEVIPSFSRCIKLALTTGVAGFFTGPIGAIITAFGLFATSAILNHREKMLLYDEIDTELKVVEKQISIAENDGDMNQYRFLLNYQKKLTREKIRIKHGMEMIGKPIINPSDYGKRGDE